MPEDKVYHVLQLLGGIEGLTGKSPQNGSMNISVNKSSERKFGFCGYCAYGKQNTVYVITVYKIKSAGCSIK